MDAAINQAVERAIRGLSQRNIFRAGADEFEVRALFPVAAWRRHAGQCRQPGSEVMGRDSCGNLFLRAPAGTVSFWDHETGQETVLAASVEAFCDSLAAPAPVVLRPGQVERAWINPDFLARLGKKAAPERPSE